MKKLETRSANILLWSGRSLLGVGCITGAIAVILGYGAKDPTTVCTTSATGSVECRSVPPDYAFESESFQTAVVALGAAAIGAIVSISSPRVDDLLIVRRAADKVDDFINVDKANDSLDTELAQLPDFTTMEEYFQRLPSPPQGND